MNDYDWVSSSSGDLEGDSRSTNWKSINGSSVCPVGFRVPEYSEIQNETSNLNIITKENLFNGFLKLPASGYREFSTGDIAESTDNVRLWTSDNISHFSQNFNNYNYFEDNPLQYANNILRANGLPVRCIQEN